MAHLRFTTNLEINDSKVKKFPFIITNKLKVDLLTLEYLLDLRASVSHKTLLTYAQHLTDFISQLETCNDGLSYDDPAYTEWYEIDDNWFEEYSNELISRYESDSDNTRGYAGQVLRTVIAYLKWTQSKGYTSNLVGIGEENRLVLNPSESKKGGTVHPLAKKLSKVKPQARTAPRMRWIEIVKSHTHIKSRELSSRYELMVDWGVGVGLRAHEVCALTVSQLPTRKSAEDAYINKENVYISIVISKGSKPNTLPVSPMLVKKTWDFVDRERQAILSRVKSKAKKSRVPFVDSGILFPSERTGKEMVSNTFSNQVRRAFLNAVEAGDLAEDQIVWAHGLRHRYATNQLKGADERGIKNPERITKHLTRHKHEQTLETYTVARFHEDG
ncbi:tyrosine-type recombinase/integrase [Vibrio cyclitrophicus]|uniref:tyrosine-type recombinase/integrase n=1 Tax=Vibrio cyclitrophicus TaxID=47951 RepID=UPI000C835CED|nr:tyrosine-type recombinase/integrase [Vibrio cyclitrophicus]PMG33338.1 hypothetical protein BCU92_05685 [Vibrio cyclitrophicus]